MDRTATAKSAAEEISPGFDLEQKGLDVVLTPSTLGLVECGRSVESGHGRVEAMVASAWESWKLGIGEVILAGLGRMEG